MEICIVICLEVENYERDENVNLDDEDLLSSEPGELYSHFSKVYIYFNIFLCPKK